MTALITYLFQTVLNMSVIAAAVIAVISLVRLPLSKAPKVITCTLWFVALFRLLCPVSFESAASLFSLRQSLGRDIMPSYPAVAVQAVASAPAVVGADTAANAPITIPTTAVDPWQSAMSILALVWAVVALGLVVYGVVSYLLLKRRIATATLTESNIYESDMITTPFVAGIFRPRVYLPVSLKAEERVYIIAHEKTHISRRDNIIKPLWFLAVCIHWFNPFAWLAFFLLGRDMEISCDEAVLRKMGDSIKADYSSSLLSLSSQRPFFAVSPLAFGESAVFARIKKVLSFKKPVVWVVIVAVIAAVALTVALVANPKSAAAVAKPSLAARLLNFKTDYIGDNAKVGGLISLLSFPGAVQYDSFSLQTRDKPYGITIKLSADDAAKALFTKVENRVWLRRDAALLFSLIGNADTVSFSLSGAGDPEPLDIIYTRDDIDKLYGPDVRTYVTDEKSLSEYEKNLDMQANAALSAADASAAAARPDPIQTAPPAVSAAASGPIHTVQYRLYRLGKNSMPIACLYTLTQDQSTLVTKAMFGGFSSSAALTPVDVNTLDECYLISGASTDDSSPNYYIFMQDGNACLQVGKYGYRSLLDNQLYASIKELMDEKISQASVEVEKNLKVIMSSPASSSNPGDYIKAHQTEYQNILKMGDAALSYMLSCFNNGEGNSLKGYVMMFLCSDLLGIRSSLEGQDLFPAEWYSRLDLWGEIKLPDYVYTGSDPITKLVYETETAKNQGSDGGFTVAAVHEFGRYAEGDKVKVVAMVFVLNCHLYGKYLQPYSLSTLPQAVTFDKKQDGTYVLTDYQLPEGDYDTSIKQFCTMPISGKTIPGLYEQFKAYVPDPNSDLMALLKSNIEQLFKQNGITDMTLPFFL